MWHSRDNLNLSTATKERSTAIRRSQWLRRIAHSQLDGRDLTRPSGEPALDAASEDRDDTDQENGDERDEQPVLRDRDTFVRLDELAGNAANLIHLSPLKSL